MTATTRPDCGRGRAHFFRLVAALTVAGVAAVAFSGCSSAPRANTSPTSQAESGRPGNAFAMRGVRPAPVGVPAPDPAARLAAALAPASLAAIDAERFPDADSVAVYQWESTRYAADGTYETEWTSVDKILTDRGLEDAASVSLRNNDFYGSITVLVARVHSPDGTARDIDLSENLAEAIDTDSLSSNIHDPAEKTLALAFPGLAVGDAIETRIRRTIRRPRCEGVYADYLTFEQDSPVIWQGVRIEGPVGSPLRSRAFRDAGSVELDYWRETNAESGTVAETWTAADVQRYFPEEDMPPAYSCTARLLLSTAPDWQSVSRWYARLCAPHLAATNAAMAALVAERAPVGTERSLKIRALFDFVSREVRYMGAMAESEAPGYEPHDVSLTFDNRYGVCRDKAALLAALLRMAGVDAWPALVNAGPRKDPDVPQPFFNHAIVAVATEDPDEPYLMMDPTSETTSSLLPEYLCEKSYLVARDEGDGIRETPPLPVDRNLASARTSVQFADDGSAAAVSEISFTGINDAAYRRHFATMPRDGVRSFCQRLLGLATSGAVLTSWSLSPAQEELRSDHSPLVLRLSCEIPAALRRPEPGESDAGSDEAESTQSRNPAPFDPPRFAEALAIASRLIGDLGLEKRRFPLETGFPCGFLETISFDRAPEPIEPVRHEGDGVLWEERLDGTNLVRSFALRKSLFSPEAYQTLRACAETSERAARAPLLFPAPPALTSAENARHRLSQALSRAVQPAPEDDAFAERRETRVDLSDWPHSWSVTTETRTRILTYSGRERHSDLQFNWQPAVEDFELLDARTISEDGTETPVNPALDVFDGDQAWVAFAPRYPAGRLKTVSFPKAEPGATLVCAVKRTVRGADFFSFSNSFGSLSSFGEESVEVVGPSRARALFALRAPRNPDALPFGPPAVVETPETSLWTLRGGGPGSTIASEANMPNASALFWRLEASASDSMSRAEAIRDAFVALSDPDVQTNAAALARSLSEPGATVAEKVRAVRDWTDLNLRSHGPAWTSLPLGMLSGADATLAARYGHYADRQILRLAMARALGLEPIFRFGASAWNDPGEDDPLSRAISPGTISAVEFVFRDESGARFVLADESRYAPPGLDPLSDATHLDLPFSSSEAPVFERPQPLPSFNEGDENSTATESFQDVTVRPDGSAVVSVRVRFRGAEATDFRSKYSQMLPEERRRDAQRRVADLSQSARALGPVETDFPPEGPCELRFMAEVPDFAAPRREGGELVFRVGREVLSPETAPRSFPFARFGTVRRRTETRIRAPEGWRLARVPDGAGDWIDADFGVALRRRVDVDPEPGVALVVSDTLCLGPCEFEPDRYPEFLLRELSTRGPAPSTVVLAAP